MSIDTDLNRSINLAHGYYICNGIAFASKIDAGIFSATVNKPIEWIFHQEVFSKHAWHIEPTESLDQLYDRRSRQLREKYDYLILSYSGGADSNNILESFIRQGLHLDEIVTNHLSRLTKKITVLDPNVKSSWNFGAEHILQATPRLQYIHDNLPKTKITELDVSDMVLDCLGDFEKNDDWALHTNGRITPSQVARYNYFHFGSMKKQFDKNLSIGIIVGVDKPKTHIKSNNNFYMSFNDRTVNIAPVDDFNVDYTNTTTELFYWSTDSLDMLCKQAHTIKHWLEEQPARQSFWRKTNSDVVKLVHERWLRRVLYTTWNNDWFQANKSTNWAANEYDTWFRADDSFARAHEGLQRGLQHLGKTIPDLIAYKNGKVDSIKQFSHEYCIGKMKE
jgi:hypothetical protein